MALCVISIQLGMASGQAVHEQALGITRIFSLYQAWRPGAAGGRFFQGMGSVFDPCVSGPTGWASRTPLQSGKLRQGPPNHPPCGGGFDHRLLRTGRPLPPPDRRGRARTDHHQPESAISSGRHRSDRQSDRHALKFAWKNLSRRRVDRETLSIGRNATIANPQAQRQATHDPGTHRRQRRSVPGIRPPRFRNM